MRTYIVYDRESGKIIHRHRQDEKLDATVGAKKERILSFVKPSHDRQRLEVLLLESAMGSPINLYNPHHP